MKTAHITSLGHLDYAMAKFMAESFAENESKMTAPALVAWRDKKTARMSPVIEDCPVESSWHDYGVSHEGQLEVDVNGDYEFIFTDSAAFESYGPSPYVSMHDLNGKEYICLLPSLRNPHNPGIPSREACVELDEWTSKLT